MYVFGGKEGARRRMDHPRRGLWIDQRRVEVVFSCIISCG